MTPAEVAKLLENQSKARSRGLEKKAAPVTQSPFASVTIDVPLPPSWNSTFFVSVMPTGKHRHGHPVMRGNVYKSPEAKAYAKTVAAMCLAAGVPTFPKAQMLRLSGEVRMERAGCDLDDRLKIFCDALNGIVFEDDEQIAVIGELVRVVDSKHPGITATFTPIDVDRYGKRKEQTLWTT